MNDEAPNSNSESEAPAEEPKEEKKARPARKSTKKVVRGVRDAKTRSGSRDADGGSEGDGGSADDQGKAAESSEEAPQEIPMVVEEAPREGRSNSGREERRRPARGRRAAKSTSSSRTVEPVDADELSKRAWKIFQADVAEEGITLIDNSTGRNLALRSFELARVFLEEQARQLKLNNPPKDKEPKRSRSAAGGGKKKAESQNAEPKAAEESKGEEESGEES